MAPEEEKFSPRLCDFAIEWAMICTINDRDDLAVKNLQDFSGWFMENLKREAVQIGVALNYEPLPVMITYSTPNNINSCHEAYKNVLKYHPEVTFVVHVLPGQGSNEHVWMKGLAERYGLIRQGVLYENTITRFGGLEISGVFRNMVQWITRSGLHLVRPGPTMCSIRVGGGKEPTVKQLKFNHGDIQEAVNAGLHSSKSPQNNISNILVSGYPSMHNQFGVAQLLTPFRVIGVIQRSDGTAIVEMENVFHAIQAAKTLNGKILDRNHTLKVEPLNELTREKLAAMT
ncbi:unnamed protein product [Caenorhabditis auriculariae]|uniref:RRM domain-containing protein n=1 Tax=Caenorhabditis auriculariae TaxID=2777116 RepID=A0A8S1GN48_9PELO|nr:unnamed protein product [Caenorhabditis auriculariae]